MRILKITSQNRDLQAMLERKHREAKSEIPIIPDGDDDELFFKLNQQD